MTQNQTTSVAPQTNPNQIIKMVEKVVGEYVEDGKLILPEGYSATNALQSAWLKIQQISNRDHQSAITFCTQKSIYNALLDTIVQGLDPVKNQCYYIMYGKTLLCQKSYFGNMSMAKRFTGAEDVYAAVVYKDDEFEYGMDPSTGRKFVTKHTQKLENTEGPIKAAYAIAIWPDGHRKTEIMAWKDILTSWKRSIVRPVNDDGSLKAGTPHAETPDQMAMRTVINRLCKPIINASIDSDKSLHLVTEAFNRYDDELVEAEALAEISENENTGDVIEITGETVPAGQDVVVDSSEEELPFMDPEVLDPQEPDENDPGW